MPQPEVGSCWVAHAPTTAHVVMGMNCEGEVRGCLRHWAEVDLHVGVQAGGDDYHVHGSGLHGGVTMYPRGEKAMGEAAGAAQGKKRSADNGRKRKLGLQVGDKGGGKWINLD